MKTDYVQICGFSLYLDMKYLESIGLTLGDVQNQITENFNQLLMKHFLEGIKRNSKDSCFKVLLNLWIIVLTRTSLLANAILEEKDRLYFQSCGWLMANSPKNENKDCIKKGLAKRIKRDLSVYIGDDDFVSQKDNYIRVQSGNTSMHCLKEVAQCEKCNEKEKYNVNLFIIIFF
jgi:hypothetical protein